jgi:hypothetical protein
MDHDNKTTRSEAREILMDAHIWDDAHGEPPAHAIETVAFALAARDEQFAALKAERDALRRSLNFNTPTTNFERRQREAFNLLCRIANHDWLDDPTELRRALDGYVEEARAFSIDLRRDMSESGCSYDKPGDVCLHHSPALAKALRKRDALRDAAKSGLRYDAITKDFDEKLAAIRAERDALRAERDAMSELLETERSNGAAFSDMISEAEVILERGCYLVKLMHENDPAEPVADNGATVWDAALVDWAHWADQAMKLRSKL